MALTCLTCEVHLALSMFYLLLMIGTFEYKYKTLTNTKPAQGWMDLADSRQRTSPPRGWDSCYSLLRTGHKMFRNWYRTKLVKGVGPVDMDEVGHSLGLKVLGDHRPGGDHLVHLQRSFCRFWGRNMFFFHFFFFTWNLFPFSSTKNIALEFE